jgi:hypothetical protein
MQCYTIIMQNVVSEIQLYNNTPVLGKEKNYCFNKKQ